METQQIALSDIEIGERLRGIDQDWVGLLAASFAERGQDTPITVSIADDQGKHHLIAGAHRMAAALVCGWISIAANVVDADALTSKLMEIDENLMRRELSALDYAAFLAMRKTVHEQLYPDTRRGHNRSQRQFVATVGKTSFSKETAARLGIDKRSVERAIRRFHDISPAQRGRLSGTRWADHGSALDALAALVPAEQEAVVDALLRAEAPARSVTEALAEVRRLPPPDLEEQQLRRLMSAWALAGKAARKRFQAAIAKAAA